MKASVVIPTYNSARTIRNCVEALSLQRSERDAEYIEIIVVDDGSTDNTKDILKGYPVIYIYQKNGGPAKARNNGMRNSTGEIVCFTDSDCVPEPDWVKKIIGRFSDDRIGGVGGSYDILNRDSLLVNLVHQEVVLRHLKISEAADFLGSFNLAYRRDILEKTGGFDESFKDASGEDNDLSYRVKKMGYKLIFDKDIKVSHYYPRSLSRYMRKQFWHGFWRVKLYVKHPDMAKGDGYAAGADFLWPVLASFIILLLPFSIFPLARILLSYSIAIGIFLQLPLTAGVFKNTKEAKFLLLAPLTFMRGFARGLGMAKGVIRFIVLNRG